MNERDEVQIDSLRSPTSDKSFYDTPRDSMDNICDLKEKTDNIEMNLDKISKKFSFDEEPINKFKLPDLPRIGVAGASGSAPGVASLESLVSGEEMRTQSNMDDDGDTQDDDRQNEDREKDEMYSNDDALFMDFINRKRERDSSSSGSTIDKVKKRTRTTHIFSSDESNDTIVDNDCREKTSASTNFSRSESSNKYSTSRSLSSTTTNRNSTSAGNSVSSGSIIKLRKKSDKSKVRSTEEDPEGDDKFEQGILREKDVVEKCA